MCEEVGRPSNKSPFRDIRFPSEAGRPSTRRWRGDPADDAGDFNIMFNTPMMVMMMKHHGMEDNKTAPMNNDDILQVNKK